MRKRTISSVILSGLLLVAASFLVMLSPANAMKDHAIPVTMERLDSVLAQVGNYNGKYAGQFTNQSLNTSGSVVLNINISSSVVSGYINFTNNPGNGPLCGAGNFNGTRSGDTIQFSFTSSDSDPGCTWANGLVFTVSGLLSGNQIVNGIYTVSNGEKGIFSAMQTASYTGRFTTLKNRVGSVIIDLASSTTMVAGFINFTNDPGAAALCGAGSFVGTRNIDSIQFSFLSNDPDAGCTFDKGLVFNISGTLSGNQLSASYAIPSISEGGNLSATTPLVDTIPPNGQITAPANGSQIGYSATTVTADAQDNLGGSGVAYVEFFVYYNGAWFSIGNDTSAPYVITWQPPADLGTQRIYFTIHIADNAGNVTRDPGGYLPIAFIANSGQENWISNRAYLNQRALGTNGDSMCSMASIAMVRASAGLVGSDFASLSAEAQRVWNTGIRGPGVLQVKAYLDRNGMSASVIWDQNKANHWDKIKQEIVAGRPVILNSNSGGGNLTSYGHYIVVVGYRENVNPALRQIIAYDPYGQWRGIKDSYYANKPNEHDTPNTLKGRFVYYTFANLGTIYSVTAQRIAPAIADTVPTSLPDEIQPFDTSEVTTYTGDGQNPYPVQVYLPMIQR